MNRIKNGIMAAMAMGVMAESMNRVGLNEMSGGTYTYHKTPLNKKQQKLRKKAKAARKQRRRCK